MSAVKKRPISVLIVTEYFFPTIGGVELHVYKLAEYLIQFGLKVVIFTRNFGSRRVGIRYLANGIKVYHHWNVMLIPPSTSPTVFDAFPYYRSVLIRENVDIIHIHMASSRYKGEFETYANLFDYRLIFTDHSLFSMCDIGPVFLNEYMRVFTMFEDNIIAVSNKHRENMVLRSYADPRKVSVIPNALESDDFKCNDEPLSKDKIVIVYISRLCERKGIDLLTQVVPLVCKNHDNVEFIIGGGGPKLSMLRGMVDRHYLHDRVKILGYVPRHEVNKVLRQGHIFLNTSQTESFCIALLEAASSGLILVSTSVGGIPEVLPHDIILLSEYDPVAVSNKIDEAIAMLHTIDTSNYHQRVKEMYSWESVAKRTLKIYYEALNRPRMTFREKLFKLLKKKKVGEFFLSVLFVISYMVWALYEFLFPRSEIEMAPDWSEKNRKSKKD
ncbi:Phosphatidylinositol N-acetylglucosaminyltransferase subunit A [Theileria parva strain Muguga]|uniref:Phosphatidylinositol N-acetylglucosaminyltransferase subunit A n=1 Tax=Theileria parva strain Muguga TaxID=333668 RepID=UPI001C61C55B|nr:Phosphatidylinositol N-acetylglucosaminyltransferase subunit A [Theileria parva strain Muguga]KAF5153292.1 Phosphatidylinositol N-acetylglucosaminyltransferase subunit A [Theileria parva strain Muguga]